MSADIVKESSGTDHSLYAVINRIPQSGVSDGLA